MSRQSQKVTEPQSVRCSVASVSQLSHDVSLVVLRHPETTSIPYAAGQYLMLEANTEKSYFSIANHYTSDGLIELHIRVQPENDSASGIIAFLREHDEVTVSLPYGKCVIDSASQSPLLFIAGGTGFAPIKAMLEQLFEEGYPAPIQLYWGARTANDWYLESTVLQWAEQHRHFHFHAVLSEPEPSWQGRTGLVHEAVIEDFSRVGNLKDFDVYIAGSPAMVYRVIDDLVPIGLNTERTFSDAFEVAPRESAGKSE